jgi:hypothetical protein
MSREDVDAAIARGEPEELLRVVLAVALHSEDGPWRPRFACSSLVMSTSAFVGTRSSVLAI